MEGDRKSEMGRIKQEMEKNTGNDKSSSHRGQDRVRDSSSAGKEKTIQTNN